MESTLIRGKLSRICEILGLEVCMIALFDICDPHSQGCTAQTDICNVWYFPNTNEFHFFTISDEDTVILRSAIYLAAADLEFAVPHAKATIEQVDLKARQAPGFRHGKG